MTPQDGALVIVLFIANFWQMTTSSQQEMQEYYKERRKRLWFSPPGWFFGIIWTILYTLKLLSGYFFLYSGATVAATPDWLAGLIALYVISMFLDKQWTVWFFDHKNPIVAFVICLLLVITSVIYLVLLWYYNTIGAAFFCYLPLAIWYVVALIWNGLWEWGSEGPKKNDTNMDYPIKGKIPFRAPLKVPKSSRMTIDL
jgi:benzodiazapine receptor